MTRSPTDRRRRDRSHLRERPTCDTIKKVVQRPGRVIDPLLALLTGDTTAVAEVGVSPSLVKAEEPVDCGETQKKDDVAHLLTPEQAAKVLAVSVRTLSRLTSNGDVPHLRMGRLVRYSRSGLADWIESRMRRGRRN